MLSVIIVNYRVPYFLELCLHSVRKTLQNLDAEIIVVDNHSADGSVELLRPLFPEVNWIVNTENTGFARANNQGLQKSSGEYILFLNPDTILPEDFAVNCLRFLQSTPKPGGIGVRMIDGNGNFLKESRRGLPTPWVAFCKLSGLTALFPRSRRFARYYLGYLPADQPHPATILSGACLLVTRVSLDQTGPFDETFFMYAEDIDLSYRLEKAGYTNYYFPGVTIVHFKGESTQKDIRYIRQFYKAMAQFRRKHFNAVLPVVSRFAMGTAIWLRASLGASIAAFHRPRPRPPKTRPRAAKPCLTWPIGDPAGVAMLKRALASSPTHKSSPDEAHATGIIYCIGKEFSFKSAIEALENKNPKHSAAFNVTGGLAVVSSSERDTKGEVWIL